MPGLKGRVLLPYGGNYNNYILWGILDNTFNADKVTAPRVMCGCCHCLDSTFQNKSTSLPGLWYNLVLASIDYI